MLIGCMGAALLALPATLPADTARYIYDALGRLSAMIDGQGNVALYTYDPAGNLVSITHGSATAPVITDVSPSELDAGASVLVTIRGTGLALESLTTSHPEIQIMNAVSTNTTIRATFTSQNPTVFGPTTLTVTAIGGTATTTLTVRQPTPTITRLIPDRGVVGTTVEIQGRGFGTKAGSNRVTFTGLGGTRVPATVLSEGNTSLTVQAPPGSRGGPVIVEVGGLTSSGVLFTIPGINAINATATQGVSADPAVASGNAGQIIQVQGSGFIINPFPVFPTISETGEPGTIVILFSNVNVDGTIASAFVPIEATTGAVTLQGSSLSGIPLQIVPTVSFISLPLGETFRPGVEITLVGDGFKEGATTVNFPGAASPVPASDVSFSNTQLTVSAPPGSAIQPGAVASLTVTTDGGTSNPLQLVHPSLATLTGTAPIGVPLDAAQPSANIGQVMTLGGSGFTTSTLILFQTFDALGSIVPTPIGPNAISPDSHSLTVVVHSAAVSQPVTVQDAFTRLGTGSGALQIVPVLHTVAGTVSAGSVLTLQGTGFAPNATQAQFPGVLAPVPVDNAAILQSGGTRTTVTVPPGVDTMGLLTVRTNGGVSNPFNLGLLGEGEVEPNDTPATATPLERSRSKSGTFNPQDDLDFYRFVSQPEAHHSIQVSASDAVMIVRMTLLAPDGITDLQTVEGEIGPERDILEISVDINSSGTFYIRLEEIDGGFGPGNQYQVSLSIPGGDDR